LTEANVATSDTTARRGGEARKSDHRNELLFQALGLVPEERNAKIVEASVTWNYTTVLNIIFAAVLVWRFVRTGGPPLQIMMSEHA
jgi:hypothetical protein